MKAAIKRTGVLAHQLRPAACASTWNVKGIDYRLLDKSFDPEIIFKFNKEFGDDLSTPFDARAHLCMASTFQARRRSTSSQTVQCANIWPKSPRAKRW